MEVGSIKAALVAAGCTVAVLAWVPLVRWWTAKPSEPQAAPISIQKCGGDEARLRNPGEVTVTIEAVWSQHAWPGTRVDLVWARDPRSPHPHYEMIAENVPVITRGDLVAHDGEPADIITVDVTKAQAQRLKRLTKVGWVRALPHLVVEEGPADQGNKD